AGSGIEVADALAMLHDIENPTTKISIKPSMSVVGIFFTPHRIYATAPKPGLTHQLTRTNPISCVFVDHCPIPQSRTPVSSSPSTTYQTNRRCVVNVQCGAMVVRIARAHATRLGNVPSPWESFDTSALETFAHRPILSVCASLPPPG